MEERTSSSLDKKLSTEVWKDLHKSSNYKWASELAKETINQGCESIPLDDVYLVLIR